MSLFYAPRIAVGDAMEEPRLVATRFFLAALIAIACAGSRPALAAHPLQTEDTGTQGVGNIEIENAFSHSRDAETHLLSYQPQLSFGVLPTLDLIAQFTAQRQRDVGAGAETGFGETNLDAKWRFYGSAPWSLGLRAGVQLAPAAPDASLPSGQVGTHELLVLTFDEAPFTVHGNIGLVQNPRQGTQRRDVIGLSSALLWAANHRLILTSEVAAATDDDADRKRWPATTLMGLIYTLVPGLDGDIGYQRSLQTPAAREWLAGLTYRFGY